MYAQAGDTRNCYMVVCVKGDSVVEFYVNETLKYKNGCVIKDGVLLKYFTDEKEIVIPDNVTEIGEHAFSDSFMPFSPGS